MSHKPRVFLGKNKGSQLRDGFGKGSEWVPLQHFCNSSEMTTTGKAGGCHHAGVFRPSPSDPCPCVVEYLDEHRGHGGLTVEALAVEHLASDAWRAGSRGNGRQPAPRLRGNGGKVSKAVSATGVTAGRIRGPGCDPGRSAAASGRRSPGDPRPAAGGPTAARPATYESITVVVVVQQQQSSSSPAAVASGHVERRRRLPGGHVTWRCAATSRPCTRTAGDQRRGGPTRRRGRSSPGSMARSDDTAATSRTKARGPPGPRKSNRSPRLAREPSSVTTPLCHDTNFLGNSLGKELRNGRITNHAG